VSLSIVLESLIGWMFLCVQEQYFFCHRALCEYFNPPKESQASAATNHYQKFSAVVATIEPPEFG
jgi:hypothetical protein